MSKQSTSVQIKKSITNLSEKIQDPNVIATTLVICFLVFHSSAFCEKSPIDELTDSTIETIFSPWLRKASLAFGGGFGLFQSYMGGSIRPLLTWGGLGLVVNYIPKMVDIISLVGA
ncbi:MAG: hypothetical protein KAR79_02040 [Simkaniaceae bacterium]|nr:hypothetical protein [Simkaniaceae bacterium]